MYLSVAWIKHLGWTRNSSHPRFSHFLKDVREYFSFVAPLELDFRFFPVNTSSESDILPHKITGGMSLWHGSYNCGGNKRKTSTHTVFVILNQTNLFIQPKMTNFNSVNDHTITHQPSKLITPVAGFPSKNLAGRMILPTSGMLFTFWLIHLLEFINTTINMSVKSWILVKF